MSLRGAKPDDTLQELYRTAAQTRAEFSKDAERAVAYYAELVKFVSLAAPPSPGSDLLDVGCGSGWSSFSFARAGYQTTGIDLNPQSFEPSHAQNLTFREGSALALPFENATFDVVVTYQCLEHIPKPEAALNEMVRVCRPAGTICIVGPNLVTPFLPMKFLVREFFTGSLVLRRDRTTPSHPYGNTAAEHLKSFIGISGLFMRKLFESRPSFTMRIPDLTPPFHADNDACYLCNPIDLVRFFRTSGFRILRRGKYGRSDASSLFAGGTWIAAERIEALRAKVSTSFPFTGTTSI
jgi:SAM-dependent methyltransferase